MKILFCDPRHHTIGVHSKYVPVALGYIATYLTASIPNIKFDIRISVDPDEIIELIKKWKPDVFASSCYIWNANLAKRLAEIAKSQRKETLTILGGPEFPSGTGVSRLSDELKDLCKDYLEKSPSIDFYCYSDGEPSFSAIIQSYLNFNRKISSLKNSKTEILGTVYLDNDKKLIVGNSISRIGLNNKVDGRDIIPSPYLTGLLDKFLDGTYIPSFETARGCPFMCTFCDQGLDKTKIVSFSTERMSQELSYVCNKITSIDNSVKTIAFHDSNWGMYKKDLELTNHLLSLIESHNWPTFIEISTPKNKKEQILEIDKILKNRVQIDLAQQSMNRDTLKLIKRDNMTNEQYLEFIKELEQRGKDPNCELIIPLPGETKQTYYDNVEILMDHGVNVGTYTLMMLQGAELGRKEAIDKYQMKSRYRVVPRDFGIYDDKKVFEIERVCVANNTMPYLDYLECRKFSFLIHFYSYSFFYPLRRLLKYNSNISFFKFLKNLQELLINDRFDLNTKFSDIKISESFKKLFTEFSDESEKELFNSKSELVEFYNKKENYEKLLNGELGDNLLRKYASKVVCTDFKETISFTIDIIERMFLDSNIKFEKIFFKDFKRWLQEIYIFDEIFDKNRNEKKLQLSYDFHQWWKDKASNVEEFKYDITYKTKFSQENIAFEKQLEKLFGKNDKVFALGKYFHQMKVNTNIVEKNFIAY